MIDDLLGMKETTIHNNRIVLPKQYKDRLNENTVLVLTIGPKNKLVLYPKENFQKTVSLLQKGDKSQKGLALNLKRFAYVQNLEGSVGRIRIPQNLIDLTKMSKEVILTGLGKYITIESNINHEETITQNYLEHVSTYDDLDYDIDEEL